MDQLPRLGKRELICLLLFTCNYVVSVWRGFLFLWVLGMGYVILLCIILYNYLYIKEHGNPHKKPPSTSSSHSENVHLRSKSTYGSSIVPRDQGNA